MGESVPRSLQHTKASVLSSLEYAELLGKQNQRRMHKLRTTHHGDEISMKLFALGTQEDQAQCRGGAQGVRNDEGLRTARANLSRGIRKAKKQYGRRVAYNFRDSRDTRRLCQGIQTITDYKPQPQTFDSDISLLNELNNFFARFEAYNTTPAQKIPPPYDDQALCLSPANTVTIPPLALRSPVVPQLSQEQAPLFLGSKRVRLAVADPVKPCTPRPLLAVNEMEQVIEPVVLANSKFSIDMLKVLCKGNTDNVLFSPLSISSALGLVVLGASGETAEQMYKTLHFGHMKIMYHDLHEELYKGGKNRSLQLVNRMFGESTQNLNDVSWLRKHRK
ncbi:unnamed protein product [Leuciscus chuanchicus]